MGPWGQKAMEPWGHGTTGPGGMDFYNGDPCAMRDALDRFFMDPARHLMKT